jgi:protocatechuate 3,4-dioxygenase alpha subunit
VRDGNGAAVPDALVEVWQADADGRYRHPADPRTTPAPPGFRGYARVATNDEGKFGFATVKPGRAPGPGGREQAPHILVNLFMRGLLRQLVTRIYFADEPSNRDDLVLTCVPEARRPTLIAQPTPSDPDVFTWNVVLQGGAETVFFDG